MKKNLLFSIFAMLCMVFATSCQNDEVLMEGNEATVTFEVGAPNIATRAYSDGMTATQLLYAVYDNNGVPVMRANEHVKGTATMSAGKASVQLQLAAGKTYNVLFWAAAEGAPYTIDTDNLTMTVDYSAAVANDEERDAFYCYKNIHVEKTGSESVTLTRPFAQLNIGTNDLAIFEADHFEVTKTQVKVSAYNQFNLATGAVMGDAETKTFAFNAVPDGQTFPVSGYEYLAMNYLLVGVDKVMTNVEFSYSDGANTQSKTYNNIPLQRNYRTNIYGQLLTNDIDVNVDINPDYNNPENNLYNVVVDGVNYDDFATAAAKAMELNKPVEFIQDVTIDADNTILVEDGKTLTLNLNGNTLAGVTDDADKNDDGNLTTADNEVMFDVRGTMNVNGGAVTLKHNSDNFGWNACTEVFYVGFNGELNVNDAHIENYGGSDMAFAIDLVNASTTRASEAGIHVNVENSTIKSSYIPVRVFNNGAGMNYVTINNTKLIGVSRAFWVHIYVAADSDWEESGKDTNGNGLKDETLALDFFGNGNTFEAKNPDRIIEFGFDNDTCINFDANGNLLEDINEVRTAEELQAALDAAAADKTTTIRFAKNITGNVTVDQKDRVNIVIDGRNYKYDGTITLNGHSRHTGVETLTIQNVNFETDKNSLDFISADVASDEARRYAHNVKVIDCTFKATTPDNSVVGMRYRQCYNMVIENCTSENLFLLVWATGGNGITIDGVNVNGKFGASLGANGNHVVKNSTFVTTDANYGVRSDANNGGSLTVTGCNITAGYPVVVRNTTSTIEYTINVDASNVLNEASFYDVAVTNTTTDVPSLAIPTGKYTLNVPETFSVYPRSIVVTTTEELRAALAAGITKIELQEGNFELSGATFAAEEVTIKGVSKENCVLNVSNSIYLENKTVNLENLTYNIDADKGYTEQAFAFIHHAVAFNLTNCNVNRLRLNVNEATIDNCDFTLTTNNGFDGYCIYYYGKNNSEVIVNNSRFNTAGKAIVMYNEGATVYNLDVVDCTFTSSNASTDKAAIQMHTELGISGTLDITRCTATGFADVNGGLWNELNNNTKVPTNKFEITVDGKTLIRTTAQLQAAINAGETEIELYDGTYDAKNFTAHGKTLTLKGNGENTVIYISQDNAVAYGTFDGSNVTFKNLTIKTRGGIYKGFARMQATYNNCWFENLYFTFHGKHVFNDCSFNANGDEHCTWTYGAWDVEYNNCQFTYGDRCINVYNEGALETAEIDFNNCQFITNNASSKGAVEINSGSFTTSVAVNMTDCTAPTYGEMVFISGWDSTNGAKATVKIDGNVTAVPQLAK